MKISFYEQGHLIEYELEFPCYFKNENNWVFFKSKNYCQVVTRWMNTCSIENSHSSNWVTLIASNGGVLRIDRSEYMIARIQAMNDITRFIDLERLDVVKVVDSVEGSLVQINEPA